MNRTEIINAFIKKYNYNSYLEIGIRNVKQNFERIKCANRVGVDPVISINSYTYPDIGYQITSDIYFENLSQDKKFDIIFIDGDHNETQVDKDIFNSLKHLKEEGTIIMHDCNPPDEDHEKQKCLTVWRSFYKARKKYQDIESYVIDTDYGCGVLRKGEKQVLIKLDDTILNYSFLEKNRKDALNLISL